MKFYQWLLTAVSITAAAFFILLLFNDDIWFVSGITSLIAVLFTFLFFFFEFRKPLPGKLRVSIFSFFVLLFIWGAWCWDINHRMCATQQSNLLEARKSIGEEAFRYGIQRALISTLYLFHKQKDKIKSIGYIFENEVRNGSDFQDQIKFAKEDGRIISITSFSNDEIILTGQETFVKGINDDFLNENGQKGKLQVKAVLTKDGIRYERQN